MNKKFIYYFIIFILIVCITGCKKNNNISNTLQDNTKEKIKDIDYSGTYKNEDSSFITIVKDKSNYKATISIYRLSTFEFCIVNDINDDDIYISCKDPNDNIIKFEFNYKTKILTIKETTWALLKIGDSFEFNK